MLPRESVWGLPLSLAWRAPVALLVANLSRNTPLHAPSLPSSFCPHPNHNGSGKDAWE